MPILPPVPGGLPPPPPPFASAMMAPMMPAQAPAPTPETQDVDAMIRQLEAPIEDRLIYKQGGANVFHAKILRFLISRRDESLNAMKNRRERWDDVDDHMQMRVDLTQGARLGDGTRDSRKKEMPVRRSVVVPLMFATLSVRHAQGLSLLLAREPEWQVEGTEPGDVWRAKLMEALIAYDLRETCYPLAAHQLVYDIERYGLAAWYVTFEREKGVILTPPLITPGKWPELAERAIRMVMPGAFESGREWALRREFNNISPVNPRRFYSDPRRSIADVQRGEWCGHGWDTGYIALVEKGQELDGPYFNLDAVKKNCGSAKRRDNRKRAEERRLAQTKLDEFDAGPMEAHHLQVRLIPRDLDLADSEKPEIWWFTWIDDEVIIRCHPSPYGHGNYTYGAAEGIPDAHSLENPGWGENLAGLQLLANWIFNVRIDALRKLLNGGGLVYSPNFFNERDILHPTPGGAVRLTKKAEEAVLNGRIPVTAMFGQLVTGDPTAGHLRDLQYITELVSRLAGANDPTQGIPLPESRTLGEVNAVLAASSQRIATTVRLADVQAIRPVAEQCFANRRQWTSEEKWYRITGDLAKELEGNVAKFGKRISREGGSLRALIGPNDVWGNYDYISHTGNLSVDPSKSPETWLKGLEVIQKLIPLLSNKQINPEGMFPDITMWLSEFVRSLGIKNVEQMYRTIAPEAPPGLPAGMPPGMPPRGGPPGMQVVPDQQFQQQVQAGNFV